MKKIAIIVLSGIILGLLIIMALSYNKKEVTKETVLCNLTNYNYLYKENRTFEVVLFSSIKNNDYLFLERNEYSLVDFEEKMFFSLKPQKMVTEEKLDDYFKHTITFLIPSVKNDYNIPKAYLKISNENKTYKGLIGSFKVKEDIENLNEPLQIFNLNGNFKELNGILTLDEIQITLPLCETIEINSNESDEVLYKITEKKSNDDNIQITIRMLEYNYYMNTTFLYFLIDNKKLILDNYLYGQNDISISNYFNNLSLFSIIKDND